MSIVGCCFNRLCPLNQARIEILEISQFEISEQLQMQKCYPDSHCYSSSEKKCFPFRIFPFLKFAHWLFPFEGWLGSNKLSGDKLQPTASLSSVEHAISSLKNLVKCNNSLRLLSYHWLNFTVIILKCVLF